MTESNQAAPEPEKALKVGNFSILSNVFTAPTTAFTQIQQNYGVIFPLFLVMILSSSVWFAYFSMVDYDWYIDYMVEASAGELSKAEQDQTRAAMSMMSQDVTAYVTAFVTAVIIALMYVIQTVYFVIVSNINGDKYEFKNWFSFVSWGSIPVLLALIAMLVTLFSSASVQLAPDQINPLSLNELFFGFDAMKGAGKILSTIHLAQLWSFVVMIIGYKKWTECSLQKSTFIVLLPFVLFYLIWALIA